MHKSYNEFGLVLSIKADAVGDPGSRRFRLIINSVRGHSGTIWMEKEQLFNLCESIQRLIVVLEEQTKSDFLEPTDEIIPSSETTDPGLEFQVARLAIGYDEKSTLFIIAAYAEEAAELEDAPAMLTLMATLEQIEKLADEGFDVCAAGRPKCVLCGGPMDAKGHVCPRHNGKVSHSS